MYQEAEAVHAH